MHHDTTRCSRLVGCRKKVLFCLFPFGFVPFYLGRLVVTPCVAVTASYLLRSAVRFVRCVYVGVSCGGSHACMHTVGCRLSFLSLFDPPFFLLLSLSLSVCLSFILFFLALLSCLSQLEPTERVHGTALGSGEQSATAIFDGFGLYAVG